MTTARASVATAHASRYLQQLCKHWGHRFTVTFSPAHGDIDFGDSRCVLDATSDRLDIIVTGEPDGMNGLEEAVADHLNRFAHREGELRIDWKREV